MKYKKGDRIRVKCVLVQTGEGCSRASRDYKGCDRGTVSTVCKGGCYVAMDNGQECDMGDDEIVGLEGKGGRLWK